MKFEIHSARFFDEEATYKNYKDQLQNYPTFVILNRVTKQ